MGYTRESVEEFINHLTDLQNAIEEANTAATEYLDGLSYGDVEEDELGLLYQSLEESLDNLGQNGLQLEHLLKEGTDK